MNIKENIVRVSEIFETERDPDSGKGLMGFVVTFPDGRIENLVLDYAQEDHDDIYHQVSELRETVLSTQNSKDVKGGSGL